jgi:superfamily I DNA/RNA helicase
VSVTPADQQTAPLLDVTWLDLSALPLRPGDPTTTDAALADDLYAAWVRSYRDQVASLAGDAADAADPFTLETMQALRDETAQLATGRLDQYQARLRAFVATNPSEDDLVTWLAERATQDAANWARLDSLDLRKRATDDFYARNPLQRRDGRYRVAPDTAAEARCREIAGRVYASYAEAEDALGSAWHKGCIHYIERAE